MRIKTAIEQPDPKRFGFQPNGSYAPAPAEIEQQCKNIQERKSAKELRARAEWAYSGPYTVPEVTREVE